MSVNRGKQFETQIKKAFDKMSDVSIDRIPDQTSGFSGSKNVSDFTVYQKPTLLYLECKAIHGNTLNFNSGISYYQWSGLKEKSNIDGVSAGIMIWFIDADRTVYVDIETLHEYKHTLNKKSINIKNIDDVEYIEIEGRKKKILYEYNMEKFMEDLMRWQD